MKMSRIYATLGVAAAITLFATPVLAACPIGEVDGDWCVSTVGHYGGHPTGVRPLRTTTLRLSPEDEANFGAEFDTLVRKYKEKSK
jgi:hypothetical protein